MRKFLIWICGLLRSPDHPLLPSAKSIEFCSSLIASKNEEMCYFGTIGGDREAVLEDYGVVVRKDDPWLVQGCKRSSLFA
jgi:hypothetical protein